MSYMVAGRLVLLGVALILTISCGSSTTSSATAPSTTTLHAEVTDPPGDAVASAGAPNPPDMVHGTVDVIGGNVTFAIQFVPGTLNGQSTTLTIDLDTDQNASTGVPGATGLGIDYVVAVRANTNQALVERATPGTCPAGSCFIVVGTASATLGTDCMIVTVPLATLGNASGRLNYRVFAYALPPGAAVTNESDVMPDTNLPPAHVP